jgi:hypothetical protein
MAIVNVNHNLTRVGGSATSIPGAAISLTTGNLLVVIIACTTGVTVSSIADTAGNNSNYVKVVARDDGIRNIEIWYVKNATGNAANAVTATLSGSAGGRAIGCIQYSGVSIVAPLDKSASGIATLANTLTTASVNTVYADEVIIAGMCGGDISGGSITPGTNFTELDENASSIMQTEERIVSATGTYDASWTISNSTNNWVGVMATFHSANVSPSASPSASPSSSRSASASASLPPHEFVYITFTEAFVPQIVFEPL